MDEQEAGELDPGETMGVVSISIWRRHGFVMALIFSWLIHLLVLVWVNWTWPVVKPPPVQYMPVELVYLPESKKPVAKPDKVEAVAVENQQANAPQAKEALSPVVQPNPSSVSPDGPSVSPAVLSVSPAVSSASPAVPSVMEGNQPDKPQDAPAVQPSPPKPALVPPPPVKPPTPAKPHSWRGVPEPVIAKKPIPTQVKQSLKDVRLVADPPVLSPALPNLSLTPSLNEMARWDQARQKTEREEVFKREEETINLNTQKVRYAAYFGRLKERIQQGWIYPSQAKQAKLSGMLTMSFTISRNGVISDITVVTSSGSDLLDDAAVQALQSATPFMPLPDDWALEKLHVKTIFEYVRGGFRWGR